MKLFAIRLLATSMIAGVPRSPAEGLQMVSTEDRDRLIDAKQAEAADQHVDRGKGSQDDGDGLDAKKGVPLRKVATDEGAAFEKDAKDDAVRAAIRSRRLLFAGSGIDPAPDEALRQTAADEKFEVAGDADTASIITAIKDGRASKA